MLSILDFHSPDSRAPLSVNATFREAAEVGPTKKVPDGEEMQDAGTRRKGTDGCWINGWVD